MFPQGNHNIPKAPAAEELAPQARDPPSSSFYEDRSPQWCAKNSQSSFMSSDLQPAARDGLWAEGSHPPYGGLEHDSWSPCDTSRAGNTWDVDPGDSLQAPWIQSASPCRGQYTLELSAYSAGRGTASCSYDQTSPTGFPYMEPMQSPSVPLPEASDLDLGLCADAKKGEGNYMAAANWLSSLTEQPSALGLPYETGSPEALPGPSMGQPHHSSDKVSPIGLKLKAYDWPPQEDPNLERRRRRAVKALHNRKRETERRENMRKELEIIAKEIDTLKSEKQMRSERIVKLKEQVESFQAKDD